MSFRPSLPVIASLLLTGCPSVHVPGAYAPEASPSVGDAPLPEGRTALFAEADAKFSLGPAEQDLKRSLRCANAALQRAPKDEAGAWRAARALYFLSTIASDKGTKEELSRQCMDAAHLATATGGSASGHFWAALCMGARAQAKSLEAIGLLPQMVEAARRALELDETIERAGPDRVLGGIFLRAPAWPTSVGDLDAALTHLARAVELDPSWAENHLLYAEALAEDERMEEARVSFARAVHLLGAPGMERWAALWSKDRERVAKALRASD